MNKYQNAAENCAFDFFNVDFVDDGKFYIQLVKRTMLFSRVCKMCY